jgi:hypothetical protein
MIDKDININIEKVMILKEIIEIEKEIIVL